MLPFVKSLVRGYRRVAAHIVPPHSCAICLDQVPIIGLAEAANESDETHAKLTCGHKFCTGCILQYIEMKVRGREVEDDQLVCPVVECRAAIQEITIQYVGGGELVDRYRTTLKRVRDEKNPMARWCPRPNCGELIMCESDGNFTCPSCGTIGCFRCRGYAHRFWFCRAKHDASYYSWERSLGLGRAVRGCPRCQIRIWKSEGCNHMTCTACRHEFCWVCATPWDASHYPCVDMPFFGSSRVARNAQFAMGYALIILIVVIISWCGFMTFVGCYMGTRMLAALLPAPVRRQFQQQQQQIR